MITVRRWNADKAHRCPECHTVVDTGAPATWRAVYECCRCRTRFARWPALAMVLPLRTCADIPAGVCPHQPADGRPGGLETKGAR
ncbi:hypothetical protein [Actinomadura violacea]|uniref:Uncharacterized protein n=1 Tax=Actinomadura violacea TaxID=2819934 RepID=A0ABS3RZC8_9ACTN|nr:hypothetical protein [Actinomadura violacea]MBO2461648.1 hypothetical protein [Actinomadura violacea]